MLRYGLASSGVDVDKEVEIVTIAPPFAADALAAGEVDGICVGEPWNSVAVDKGVGAIVTVTSHIWQRGVEKVLAIPTERMESERDLVHSVIRALYNAGKAFIQPQRLEENAAILARAESLDGPAQRIDWALSHRIKLPAGDYPHPIPDL